MLIAKGIFSWDGAERRSQRYGAFTVDCTDFNNDVETEAFRNKYEGRCWVYCRVVETRKSGHLGDQFLKISPSTPKVGEIIELGVGNLKSVRNDFIDIMYELHPEDSRKHFWIDPRILYRLHDQTVEIYAEETDQPCHPAPDLAPSEAGMISTGDGSFAFVGDVSPEQIKVKPKVDRLGRGLFELNFNFKTGERVDFDVD